MIKKEFYVSLIKYNFAMFTEIGVGSIADEVIAAKDTTFADAVDSKIY